MKLPITHEYFVPGLKKNEAVSSEGLHPAGDGHVLGESNINLKMAHIIISHLEPTKIFYFLSTCTLISQDSSNHLIFLLKESLLIHVQNRWHFMMCRYCPQMIKMLRRSKFVITGCFFRSTDLPADVIRTENCLRPSAMSAAPSCGEDSGRGTSCVSSAATVVSFRWLCRALFLLAGL